MLGSAIDRRMCVTATYNRCAVILAPHSLFTRHGDLFLRAVTLETDGRKPREPRLGTFKLSGLHDLAPTRRLFLRSLFHGIEPPAPAGEGAAALADA